MEGGVEVMSALRSNRNRKNGRADSPSDQRVGDPHNSTSSAASEAAAKQCDSVNYANTQLKKTHRKYGHARDQGPPTN